jgi:hypothetical protein
MERRSDGLKKREMQVLGGERATAIVAVFEHLKEETSSQMGISIALRTMPCTKLTSPVDLL